MPHQKKEKKSEEEKGEEEKGKDGRKEGDGGGGRERTLKNIHLPSENKTCVLV